MTKKIIIRTLSTLALIGCIFFIFHNSLQAGVVSEVRSEETTDFLRLIFGKILAVFLEDDHYVRKLAHIIEYMGLGIITYINLIAWNLRRKHYIWLGIVFGVVVAGVDETIQRFVPGRSGEIRDVFIDFSGFLLGFFICLMLVLWYNKSQCAKRALKEEWK